MCRQLKNERRPGESPLHAGPEAGRVEILSQRQAFQHQDCLQQPLPFLGRAWRPSGALAVAHLPVDRARGNRTDSSAHVCFGPSSAFLGNYAQQRGKKYLHLSTPRLSSTAIPCPALLQANISHRYVPLPSTALSRPRPPAHFRCRPFTPLAPLFDSSDVASVTARPSIFCATLLPSLLGHRCRRLRPTPRLTSPPSATSALTCTRSDTPLRRLGRTTSTAAKAR